MKFCSKCGHELVDDAIVCTNCGCAVAGATKPNANEEDEVSIGLCVLAAFIPLFGIIYWPVCHKKTPKRAKACGITGIVSWAIGVVFYLLMMSTIFTSLSYWF